MSRWINRGAMGVAFAALAGCDYYAVVPGVTTAVSGEPMPPVFQIGDTVQFYAREVFVCHCEDPGAPVPPSAEAPEHYQWAATTDRAFYLGHGKFVMTKLGDIAFFVSTKRAATYSFMAYVGPRVSGVRFSAREIALSSGDSAVAGLDAIDATGAPIPEYRSVFYSMYLEAPPDETTALAFRKLGGRVVVYGRTPGETLVIGNLSIWNASQFHDTLRVTVR
jgi:hypothetical protein